MIIKLKIIFSKKSGEKVCTVRKKSSNFATQKGNREPESRFQTERFNLRKGRIPEAKPVD